MHGNCSLLIKADMNGMLLDTHIQLTHSDSPDDDDDVVPVVV